eukprot:1729405-Pyramimonas_sp.AAC.1
MDQSDAVRVGMFSRWTNRGSAGGGDVLPALRARAQWGHAAAAALRRRAPLVGATGHPEAPRAHRAERLTQRGCP